MTRYAGIDAHTGDLHVTVLDEGGEEVDHFTAGNDASGFATMTEKLHADDHVAIEACDPAYPSSSTFFGRGSTCMSVIRRNSAN